MHRHLFISLCRAAAVAVVVAAGAQAQAATPVTLSCDGSAGALSTASNRNGGLLASGAVDLGWTSGTGPVTGGTDPAYVFQTVQWTGTVPGARYISHVPNGAHAGSRTDYYRLQFVLDSSVDTARFTPRFVMRADNAVADVRINGTSLVGTAPGLPQGGAAPFVFGGFLAARPALNFPVAGPWVAGLNTVVVQVQSNPSLAGLAVGVSGAVPCTAEILIKRVPTLGDAMLALTALLLGAAAAFRLRRRARL